MFYLPKSSLELTFSLIRHTQPSLALKIRNLVMNPDIPKGAKQAPITIEEDDVFTIVNQLMHIEDQARIGSKADKGRQILASALIADWLTFNLNDD
ncbi:hypothetical protein NBRC116188_00310 [Oceaniserpentilla sp. 4NH20-0058]|uniref:hypothetical protein n=1 Tax=Oceaniserpentilla sp. 4NH20-0058 TaxID=3127660 RepID=UPI00310C247C